MYNCMQSAALAAVNTTLAISTCAISTLVFSIVLGRPGDIGVLLNGILAGAVSATASCALVEPYAAAAIGVVGAMVYLGSSAMLQRLGVDDPLDASPVHLFCGAWGTLAAGLFATERNVVAVYGYANGWGAFYGGGGVQLGVQVLGIGAIAAWAGLWAAAMFLGLKRFGCLRVSREDEQMGLDMAQGIGSGQLLGCMRNHFNVAD
jgi:Amt family ammonium transporter